MAARQTQPSEPHPPLITGHAVTRWHERRAGKGKRAYAELDLWSAWIDAKPIELPDPWSRKGDEARYHADAQVVLCRRGSEITTVYDLTGEDAHPHVRRCVLEQKDIAAGDL